ncbi:MAG: tyrosine-type recombinase/integrase, partial [Polyangiaceae bacterium]
PGTTGAIRVRNKETFRTKSRKPRLVPIAPELRAILDPLARPRGLCFPSPVDPEKPLSRNTLRHAVERLAKESGVKMSLHDLRRSMAGFLSARGVPVTRIRDYLGHASVATTEAYYIGRGALDPADVEGLSFGSGPSDAPKEDPGRETA